MFIEKKTSFLLTSKDHEDLKMHNPSLLHAYTPSFFCKLVTFQVLRFAK